MSRSDFYQYLFAREVLFKLPPEHLSGGQEVAEEKLPVGDTAVRPEETPVTQEEALSPFSRLRTRIIIIVNTYGKGIRKEEREFLEKVLKAVNYDLDRVDLLELDQIALPDASAVLDNRLADYILLFGVKPEMLHLEVQLDLFEPRLHNGTWLLMSNSLLRIEMEESKRRELWTALKKMFLR